MKTILLFTGLLLLSAGALMAQSKGRSTKYTLFPDYDADIAKMKKNESANSDVKSKSTRSPREQIFTDYKPQSGARTVKPVMPGSTKPNGVKSVSEAPIEKVEKVTLPTAPPAVPQQPQAPKQ